MLRKLKAKKDQTRTILLPKRSNSLRDALHLGAHKTHKNRLKQMHKEHSPTADVHSAIEAEPPELRFYDSKHRQVSLPDEIIIKRNNYLPAFVLRMKQISGGCRSIGYLGEQAWIVKNHKAIKRPVNSVVPTSMPNYFVMKEKIN